MKRFLIHTTAAFMLILTGICAAPVHAQKATAKGRQTTARAKSSSGTPGEYPEASERLLTEKDMEHLTPWGMKVMLSEIYARHGYVFSDATMKKHFRKAKWYKGKERNAKKIKLSDTEIQNLAFIRQHQTKAKI